MHQRIDTGIHLKNIHQVSTGDINSDQLTLRSHAQRCRVENITDTNSTHGNGLTNDAGSRQRQIHRLAGGLLHRPFIGIGEDIAKGGLMGSALGIAGVVKLIGILHQDLIKGHAVIRQIPGLHLGLVLLHQCRDLGIIGHGLINGDQLIAGKLHIISADLQLHNAQILAVIAGGDDPGIPHNDGLLVGAVGVGGNDQVNPGDRLC